MNKKLQRSIEESEKERSKQTNKNKKQRNKEKKKRQGKKKEFSICMQRLLGYWDNNWKRSFFYVGKKNHSKTHLWTGRALRQASLRNFSLSTSGKIASRQSKKPLSTPFKL